MARRSGWPCSAISLRQAYLSDTKSQASPDLDQADIYHEIADALLRQASGERLADEDLLDNFVMPREEGQA